MGRLLVIDADLNPRIASELRKRGRNAKSLQHLGWKTELDPDMLRLVYGELDDPVIVTSDDDMPNDHGDVIAEVNATVAVIEPWELHHGSVTVCDDTTSEEETYEREVIHRWAPSMQDQERGTVKRYFLKSTRLWKARK